MPPKENVQAMLRRAEKMGAAKGLRGARDLKRTRRRLVRMDEQAGWIVVASLITYVGVAASAGALPALVSMAAVIGLVALARAVVTKVEPFVSAVATLLTWVGGIMVIPGAAYAGVENAWMRADPMVLLLPLAAAFGPYLLPRPVSNRGVTTVYADITVLIGSTVALTAPWVGLIIGIVGVLGVLGWRSGLSHQVRMLQARLRSGVRPRGGPSYRTAADAEEAARFSDKALDQGVAAELRTASALLELDGDWRVLHSRTLPGTSSDVDHLVIGRAGVFVIDSKDRKGRVSIRKVDDPDDDEVVRESVTWNGREEWLFEHVDPVVDEAFRVAWALRLPPEAMRVAIAFTERTKMPQGECIVRLTGVYDELTKTERTVEVHLLHIDDVVSWLHTWPENKWVNRGWLRRWRDRRRGLDDLDADRAADVRHVRDLATVADYVLPPSL